MGYFQGFRSNLGMGVCKDDSFKTDCLFLSRNTNCIYYTMSTSEIGPIDRTITSTSIVAGGPEIQKNSKISSLDLLLIVIPPKSGRTLLSYPLNKLSNSSDIFS